VRIKKGVEKLAADGDLNVNCYLKDLYDIARQVTCDRCYCLTGDL
jgi:hypothetical protein